MQSQYPNRATMVNQAPKQALVRRAYQTMQFAVLFASAGIFFGIIGVALFVVPLATESSAFFTAYDIIRGVVLVSGAVLVLVGIGLAIRAATWKTDNDLARLVGEALKPMFDDRYYYIRNLSRRGLGYIDSVLIGPEGLLVFRILDFRGEYLNEGQNWLKAKNGQWQPLASNPTANVIEDMTSLEEYLTQRGLPNFPIFGVVLFTRAEPDFTLRVKPPNRIPALLLRDFQGGLQEFFAHHRIDDNTAKRVYRLLYED